MFVLLPIILFILILSVLVFIHEMGHFMAARFFGIKVEEFGLGIPPRAWGKKIGETLYSINWLPLGGFVRIKGEDFIDYKPNDERNFLNKKPWQQAVVLVAGVVMNLILAVTIFYFILATNGWKSSPLLLLNDYKFPFGNVVEVPNIIVFMEEDSPALNAGMEFADQIQTLSYMDETISVNSVEDVKAFLSDKPDSEIRIEAVNINTDERNIYTVIPEYNENIDQPALGVSLGEAVQLTYTSPAQKLTAGFSHSANVLSYSMSVFGNLISRSVQEKSFEPVSAGVSGPVGIFGAVRSILSTGGPKVPMVILDLTALLSLSLAFMNLLPIPALDGGRLVFVITEWITGKRPSAALESKAHQVGFAILLGLIAVITLKDIWQLF